MAARGDSPRPDKPGEWAVRRLVPKFMELHRAGRGWRCRGCSEFIAIGARAVGVTGLYGPNAQHGHGSQTIFHPRCVAPWTRENGHLIPLAGDRRPDRAAYLRAWRARHRAPASTRSTDR